LNRYDKIKAVIGIVLIVLTFGSFIFLGKDHTVTRSLAASSIIIWLLVMAWIGKMKSKEENKNPD
jgi:hypothetical protein